MTTKRFQTALEAETAFYTAIEQKDMTLMKAVWQTSEQVVCVHPMGGRLQGHEAVFESWQQIFTNKTNLKFSLQDRSVEESGMLCVHILHEYITPEHTPDKTTIVNSCNVYKLTEDGWKMTLHHAAISAETVSRRPDLASDSGPAVH